MRDETPDPPILLQSFADLERGLDERAPLAQDTSISPGEVLEPWIYNSVTDGRLTVAESDLKFKALAREVSVQIHKINANVQAITKLVSLLGTPRDDSDLRTKL